MSNIKTIIHAIYVKELADDIGGGFIVQYMNKNGDIKFKHFSCSETAYYKAIDFAYDVRKKLIRQKCKSNVIVNF